MPLLEVRGLLEAFFQGPKVAHVPEARLLLATMTSPHFWSMGTDFLTLVSDVSKV